VEKAQSTPPLALCGEHTDMGPIDDECSACIQPRLKRMYVAHTKPQLNNACQPELIIDLPTCEWIKRFQNAKK
jgi:hypothetical protein